MGRPLALAVDRSTGGGEHNARPRRTRCFEHVHGAEHVDGGIAQWLGDGDAHVRLRGEMHYRVSARFPHDPVERLADVVNVEDRGRRHVLPDALREVVHDMHFVAPCEQCFDDV